jgi:hypothetical protein
MAARDPEARRTNATIAAHAKWKNTHNRAGALANARKGMRDKLAAELKLPDDLDPKVRERCIDSAMREHMVRLAKKSAAARRREVLDASP